MKIKFLCLAMAMSLMFVACGGDDDSKDEGIVVPDSESPGSNVNSMTPKEQKEYLEQTARQLLSRINANDFKPVTDILNYVEEKYSGSEYYDYRTGKYVYEGYDNSVLDDWFESALELCEGTMSNNVQKNFYTAANFRARFVAGNNGWEKQGSSDGLEFHFTDAQNQACVLKIWASDRYTKAHLSLLDETRWKYVNGKEIQQRYENAIGVPAEATATLTRGGTTLVSVKVNTALKMAKEDIDLATDNYEATADVSTCGYNVVVEKASFMGDNKAYAAVKVFKGSEQLLSAEAEANGKVRLTTQSEYRYGYYREWTEFEVKEAGRGVFKVDVQGKVQAIGEIKDIDRFLDYSEKTHDNRWDEANFKRAIDNANEELNIGLYYDGKNTRMATVKLSTQTSRKYGEIYYEAVPAIYFNDGTSYSFEEYFDETYFKKVINNFEDLVNDFKHLIK